jgi:hypothetical protein
MFLYAVTIFLSAFLLFQVQPIVAKMILPWFGGTAAVWATCMVFFQAVLLLGYLYAHGSIRWLTPKRQWMIHAAVLAGALLFLPILPAEAWKPADPAAPIFRILGLLAATVGLPYMMLSSTSPLLQAWYVQANPGAIPYRLFALSNAGSMLALLSYPIAIEPNLTLRQQAIAWSIGFAAFVLLCSYLGWRSHGKAVPLHAQPEIASEDGETPAHPTWGRMTLWLLLAAGPSMLLIAMTNHLSMDVAPIPFLWILPLAIYLLTFILCFDTNGWYRRNLFLILAGPSLGGLTILLDAGPADRPDVRITLALFIVCFFVICMVSHGELSRLKPDPRHLTLYYLMISGGGVVGGAFVALIAPSVFNAYYDFPLSVIFCAVTAAVVLYLDRSSSFREEWLGWPSLLLMSAVALVIGFNARIMHETVRGSMVVARNFYGELRVRQYGGVYDWNGYRSLVHGEINHGEQYTHPARRREPVAYYCSGSGVGMVMNARVLGTPQRVGIIGLGTGTLAAFSRVGDVYRFYEINPLVEKIANEDFTYLKQAEAPIEVVLGDARLMMERERPQGYDILILDAFASDSIPVHLLTREAFRQYVRHLSPDGVIVVHISNRFIDLEPVLDRAAQQFGLRAHIVETSDDKEGKCYGTTWVVMTRRLDLFDRDEFKRSSIPLTPTPWLRAWTDDFSNLYRLLK